MISQQRHWFPGRQRCVRPNRVNVQDETDIINEWNRIVQLFSDQNDPSLIVRLKVEFRLPVHLSNTSS